MVIVGLEQYGGKEVGEFLMDKYEVTNAQFKIFMDAGGYANPEYWNIPIFSNGKIIPLEKAAVPFYRSHREAGTCRMGSRQLS